MNLTPDSQIGNFTIIRLLGTGGMSEVYLAKDNLDRQFAIKILAANLTRDPSFQERFRQEAKIMASLHHPNIVQLHSYFELDDLYCLVMEYIEGGSLKDLIKQTGPIPEERALNIFNQIAEALAYAHDKEIVHRDIKPSNIMFDKDGNVKVMDFGIARMKEGPGLTRTGTQMGTLVYMSPEQIRDSKHIDSKSDVYSLGVTLYEMLTGQSPYDEDTESDYDIRVNIVNKDIPDPTLIYPHISESTVKMLKLLTQKEKQNRPDTSKILLMQAESVPSLPDELVPVSQAPAIDKTTNSVYLQDQQNLKRRSSMAWIVGIAIILFIVFILSIPRKGYVEYPVEELPLEEMAVEDISLGALGMPWATLSDDGPQLQLLPLASSGGNATEIVNCIVSYADSIKQAFLLHSNYYPEPYGELEVTLDIRSPLESNHGNCIAYFAPVTGSNYSSDFLSNLQTCISNWRIEVQERTVFKFRLSAGWG